MNALMGKHRQTPDFCLTKADCWPDLSYDYARLFTGQISENLNVYNVFC